MPALDTNVLVRFLVQDDPAPSTAAVELIGRAARAGASFFVPVTVALELEWVLRARYEFDKATVLQTLSELLSVTELRFESEQALEVAVHLYRTGSADFADGLHVALAAQAGEAPLLTFDRRASRLDGARPAR